MAVVLFIITIPTETEELLLQSEFRKKKPDIGANYGREDKLLSTPVTTATTTATLSNLSNATTTTAAVTINITDANEIDIVSLGAKMDNPLTTQTLDQQQYSTFPKRRRSEGNKFLFGDAGQLLKNSIFRDSSTGSASDSAKDIDVEIVDGPPFIRKSWEGLRDILSSSSRKRKRDSSQLNIPSDSCMETVLREILKRSQIFNAVWTKDTDGRMHQLSLMRTMKIYWTNFTSGVSEIALGRPYL
uniref:Uncharacterized protein n=1 Tax=Bactrocera dorsalis TaxID=27457 RepID=A0A034WL24_BACDO